MVLTNMGSNEFNLDWNDWFNSMLTAEKPKYQIEWTIKDSRVHNKLDPKATNVIFHSFGDFIYHIGKML